MRGFCCVVIVGTIHDLGSFVKSKQQKEKEKRSPIDLLLSHGYGIVLLSASKPERAPTMNEDSYLDSYWEDQMEINFYGYGSDFEPYFPEEDFWYEDEGSDDLPDWAV
jgi:hypothetical protein